MFTSIIVLRPIYTAEETLRIIYPDHVYSYPEGGLDSWGTPSNILSFLLTLTMWACTYQVEENVKKLDQSNRHKRSKQQVLIWTTAHAIRHSYT